MKFFPTLIFLVILLAGCNQTPHTLFSNTSVKSETKQATNKTNKIDKRWTQVQKAKMNQSFYNMMNQYAKQKDRAVTNLFYTHTKHTIGDWYAITPDGDIQMQDNNMPGFFAFDHHVVGGVTIYASKSGKVGKTDEVYQYMNSANYSKVAKPGTFLYKYIAVDNGNVYVLYGDEHTIDFCTGFMPMDDHGNKKKSTKPTVRFERVTDQTIIKKWRNIMKANAKT